MILVNSIECIGVPPCAFLLERIYKFRYTHLLCYLILFYLICYVFIYFFSILAHCFCLKASSILSFDITLTFFGLVLQ